MTRHVLTLVEAEAAPWAACGPCSLAALLGRSLADVRPAFPVQTETKRWVNLTMMDRALAALGLPHSATPLTPNLDRPAKTLPILGLALIQLCGSWDRLPVNHPGQLFRTHWIAVAPAGYPVGGGLWTKSPGAFEVNLLGAEGLEPQHGWTSLEAWKAAGPKLLASQIRGATGAWWVRAGIEVSAPW